MKPLMNRRFVIAVLTIACLAAVLLVVAPIRSSTTGSGGYDPWLDVNDDGKIDMKDIGNVAFAFGTNGQNISKASLMYDSGWLDLRNETEQYYTITHNLNDTELQVDAREISSGWNRTYGGISDEMAYDLVQTSDGGYALAGDTSSFGAGNSDFWLVKTDTDGNVQWNKTYAETDDDGATALVQTSDGGYALAGYGLSYGAGLPMDSFLVKTDANGTMQWNQTYKRGTDDEYAYALVQTSDGGYALAGDIQNSVTGDLDFWLVKTDGNGNALWNRTYGRTSDEELNFERAFALVETVDGGYALTGIKHSDGMQDAWLVKTDGSGNMQWNQTYGGIGNDLAAALVQTSDGGYALAGLTRSFGAGNLDAWLVKTDTDGNVQWNKAYGGTYYEFAHALVQMSDGGYALAGRTNSSGAGDYDFWLVKTDAHGNAGGVESGLAWVISSANTITLYKGATDTNWNYVRVRLWKPR